MRPLIAPLVAAFLLPLAALGGYLSHRAPAPPASPTDGLARVATEQHYGWVVTAGKFKGQTTDPRVVLQYAPEDRPPARFVRISCQVWAASKPLTLAARAVQVCRSIAVPEAEVRRALTPDAKEGA